jgi:transcriptional regulator
MERGRRNSWRPEELGVRYDRLISHVVAFRADVVRTQAKFKLGKNERSDVLKESLIGVEQDGLSALTGAMLRANANRLKPPVGSVSANGSHESERATAGT